MHWPTEPRSKTVSGSIISKSCHISGTFQRIDAQTVRWTGYGSVFCFVQ